ncbi:unnamed protein product [Ectocarpus sp. CCAP 1310/34]|nr:unnamed protein product [Ectocarpus sp. CCAP 1310/34]
MQEARRLLENPRELHGLRNKALDHPRVCRGTRSAEDLDRQQLRNLAATLPDNGLVKILRFSLGDLAGARESVCRGGAAGAGGVEQIRRRPGCRCAGSSRPPGVRRRPGCLDSSDPLGSRGCAFRAGVGWEAEGVSSTGAAHQSTALRDAKALESTARGDLELHRACPNGGTVTDTRVGEMMLDFLCEAIEIHAAANGGPTVNGMRRCDELEEARDQGFPKSARWRGAWGGRFGAKTSGPETTAPLEVNGIRRCDELEEAHDQGLLEIREVAGRVGREVRGQHVRTRDDCAAGSNASWTGRSQGVNEEEAEAAKREAKAVHAPAPEEEKAKTAQAFGAATNRVEMAKTAKKCRGTGGKIAAGVAFVRTGILFVVHMLLLLFWVVDVDDVNDDDAKRALLKNDFG